MVEWLHGDGYVERKPRRRYMSGLGLRNNASGRSWSARASQGNPASQLACLHDPKVATQALNVGHHFDGWRIKRVSGP